jgi:hypothetical protein
MANPFLRFATAVAIATALPLAGCKDQSAPSVEVTISVADSTPTLKHATILVDYGQSGARPRIASGSPACTSILPHVSCRFTDSDGTLTIEADSPQGFSGPVDLAVCRMTPETPGADAAKITGRLRVEITDARGSDGQAVADIKVAAKREKGQGEATADGKPTGVGSAHHGARDTDSGDTAGAGSAATGASGATNRGMVVTQDDLAAREQRRAEDQMKAREAQKRREAQAAGEAASGTVMGGDTGAVMESGEDEVPLDEEPGSGVNDATDDDARATEYGVRFELAQTSGPLGALQFDVNYSGGSGGWLGAGGGAACTWLVSAAIHACNDKRGGDLTCALVDTNGIAGPLALMECTFKSRNSVAAGDFSVRVTDASTPDLEPADARVFVSGVYAR